MVFNSNGVIISGVTRAEYSTYRDDYILIWDDSGCPIHIKQSVIDYLCTIPPRPTPAIFPVDKNDLFI